MTLGDIIKEYIEDHSLNDFIEDSGLSRAYVYILLNNKNTLGKAPTPTIDTINKVAKGIHSDFNTVFSKLDQDTIISTTYTNRKTEIGHSTTTKKELTSSQSMSRNDLFTVTFHNDYSINIEPKKEYYSYFKVLRNKEIRELLNVAIECSPSQIEAAINVLKAFKRE